MTLDSFNRADGVPGNADTGEAWSIKAGIWTIASDLMVYTSGSGNKDNICIDHGVADGVYKVKFIGDIYLEVYGGIVVRWIDQNNFIRVYLYKNISSVYHLYVDMYDSGVYSNPIAGDLITFVSGAELKLTLFGTSLDVDYNNGAYTNTVTVTNVTGTNHGLMGSGDHPGRNWSFDDWSGTSLAISDNPNQDIQSYIYENVGLHVVDNQETYGQIYENVGFLIVDAREAYGYINENVGVTNPNPGDADGYIYEDTIIIVPTHWGRPI